MTLTLRRWSTRLTHALLLLVALAAVALFVAPKLLGYDTYVITTGSMAGTVDPGGLVIADRVAVGELAVGDVITYLPPASSGVPHLVTHRITDIGTDAVGSTVYRTQGDANASPDPWTFSLDQPLQARAQWMLPAVGWPVLWLADPQVRMLAIGLPAAAIALLALKDVVVALLPVRQPGRAAAVQVGAPQVIDLTAHDHLDETAPRPALDTAVA